MLGGIALLGLKPWATASVSPNLSVSPGLGAALGNAEAVAKEPSAGVADRQVAGGESTALAVKPAAHRPARSNPQPSVGVSQGRAVEVSESAPISAPPTANQPAAAPPEAAPEPPSPPGAPAPLIAGVEEGAQNPPVAAGVEGDADEPAQSCEGDHYAVTITYETDEASGEQLPTEILIQQVGSDGSASELHIEGDLTDYRDLIAGLTADGGCVQVEFATVREGGDAGEAPEAGVEAAGPSETPEPAAP